MKYTKITWEDHFSESSWKHKDDMKEWANSRTKKHCITVGTITFEDKDKLVLSASFDGEENYGENMCIIKKNIVKTEEL